jgi:sugar lactone lactonase YvrE
LAFDIAGNLYIAGGRVRKVDTYGIITTVAGGGSANPGDGGSATNAQISAYGVCVDSFGNLFIADYWGCRIRKVDTSGILTTIAGNGGAGYSGDGGAATNAGLYYPTGVIVDSCGNVLIADEVNGRVRKVDTSGIITTVAGGGAAYLADGVPATNATLSCPWSLALDGTGNLLVADQGHNRIRRLVSFRSPLRMRATTPYSSLIFRAA